MKLPCFYSTQVFAMFQESQPTVTKSSKVGKKTDRYVDWRQVAILHGNRRSAFSCFCCFMRTIHNPRSWSHTEMSLLKRLVYSFKFQMKVHQVTFIKRKWFVKVINPDVESAGLEACEDQKFLFLLVYFPFPSNKNSRIYWTPIF